MLVNSTNFEKFEWKFNFFKISAPARIQDVYKQINKFNQKKKKTIIEYKQQPNTSFFNRIYVLQIIAVIKIHKHKKKHVDKEYWRNPLSESYGE